MRYELHPRNSNFHWRAPEPPFRRLHAAAIAAFDEVGFIVVPDAFDAQELGALTGAIDPLEAEAEAYLRGREQRTMGIARAGEITFCPHLVVQSTLLRQLAKHPLLVDLCHDLIGPDVRLYWDQSVYKKPGADKEFPWHQDNGYTYVEPQQYLTCWIALTDATVANGCPWLLPGLHRLGTLNHRWTALGFECLADVTGAVPVELAAGSIAVFSSLTPHRTGPNRTNGVRKAYILQYAPDGAMAYPPGAPPAPCADATRQFLVLHQGEPA